MHARILAEWSPLAFRSVVASTVKVCENLTVIFLEFLKKVSLCLLSSAGMKYDEIFIFNFESKNSSYLMRKRCEHRVDLVAVITL